MQSSASPQPTPPQSNGTPSTAPPTQPATTETTGRRRGCELDTRTRIQLSTLKDIAGWSYRQIHERFPDIPLSTIKSTCRKVRERESIESQKRSGRPKILDADDREKLIQKIKENPHTPYKDLLAIVNNKCTKRVITRFFAEEKIDVQKLRAMRPLAPPPPILTPATIPYGGYIPPQPPA